MKIHPLTVCREKLQNNDFITTNYRKKAEMLEDIIAEEEELRNFAAEIYFEISNKILVRNSKRRKVLDCLKKLNLEYNYTSYVTDFDEINTMLEQFENRCQQLLGKKNDFSDAIENDYLNSRNILRNSIMDDTDIYNSISTVNPRIYEKMKWYLEGELRNNTETRKLELVLARIVSHAFTKTSPMGWLNKVGIIGTMNPIRYELKKNNISLNFVLLFQMYDRIILRDEYIEDVKFKLNKNFYIVDSEINIFGQRDNAQNHKLFKSRDCNVKVKNNPYFAPILNQADKNDWYFKDILELLELDKEQTGVFIRKLVEIGLFRIDSYFSDEGDVLQHFVDKLGEITKEKDDLASCVRGDFVEIQKLVKEINQEYSLDLEKRIIEIEKSACEKCGLDAGFKSREFIYKDNIVVKDKVHNLPESAQYSISKLMQLYTIFDVNTNSDIEIKVIGHESEQLTKLLENRIQMYFGDFSSNKVTRKTQIIVVDQRNDLDKIEEAIANIEADNYIVMAFNANKESWIYSTKIKSEVIQMLDQFMCCSEKKVRFSDAFCAVAANYMVLMLMDSLSGYRKMFNTYCINSSLEIKNKSFYGLKLGADAFRKVKEDYVRIDESVTEAEALNRFIVKSKDIIDMNFEYEFKNDGNINRVITRVKDKEVIEAEGKNELLLDAAKESVTETIIKLFQSYGVKVSLALGFDEIKRLFASEKSVYAFDDKGIFSKEGVLIFRVD